MKIKLLVLVVALALVLFAIWLFWPSRKQIEDVVIDVYLKIVCER